MRKLIFSLAMAMMLFPVLASRAAVIRVPEEMENISGAVAAASPGDVIIVDRGTYRENVVVERPVAIRASSGPEDTVIEALDPQRPALSVTGTEDVTVTGFTFTGSEVAGLEVKDSRRIKITGNRSLENSSGLYLVSSSECIIKDNNFDSNTSFGIYLERSHRNRIEGNTASSNRDKGIFISYSNDNLITGNSANLNAWNGILIWTSTGNRVTGNRVLRNMYGLVDSEPGSNEIAENTSLPNIFIIMPVFLIYLGVVLYLVQKAVLKRLYGEVKKK